MSTGDWEQPGGGQAADSGRGPAATGPQSVWQGLHEGLPRQSRRLHTAGPTASLLQGTCLLTETLQTLKHKNKATLEMTYYKVGVHLLSGIYKEQLHVLAF